MESSAQTQERPSRFDRKQHRIIAAATALMNEHGVKGMTLTKVASAIDLNTTSVTYYFKRKELLAEAILADALNRYQEIAERAAAQPTPRERLRSLIWDTLSLFARIRNDEEPPIANLAFIRSLDDPVRAGLTKRYLDLFRLVRSALSDRSPTDNPVQTARTHVLLEQLFWAQAWLRRYSLGDFERLGHRLADVLAFGVAPEGAAWKPSPLEPEAPQALEGKGDRNAEFLRAATMLINERGYRGASVERIAAELQVTKGSFYHHLESKDDLVLACFDLSYSRVSLAQRAAQNKGGSYFTQLSSAIGKLIEVQFFTDDPLLRTAALSALPSHLRDDVIERSNRMARRFAGMLIDGIIEGSVRPVDPLIAAQVIMASLNTAYELRRWAKELEDEDQAIELYASIITSGIIDD